MKRSIKFTKGNTVRTRLQSTGSRFIKALPLTVLFTVAFQSAKIFHHLDRPVQDFFTHFSSSEVTSDVAIVRITEDDYRSLFKQKSPLDPAILKSLVDAIAQAGAKIIAVGLDTSDPTFKIVQPSGSWPPIIWGREAKYSNVHNRFYLSPLLGGQEAGSSGLVLLNIDSDGIVRKYTRVFNTDRGPVSSLCWEIINHLPSREATKNLSPSQEELSIRFIGKLNDPRRISLPSSEVLEMARSIKSDSKSILNGKIVLIGGDYQAQDEHQTPLGWMLGIEILAQILETELSGGGAKAPSETLLVMLIIVAGVLLWLIFYRLSLPHVFLVALFAIPILSATCSVIAYGSIFRFTYFMPILVAVLGEQLVEHSLKSSKEQPSETNGSPASHKV